MIRIFLFIQNTDVEFHIIRWLKPTAKDIASNDQAKDIASNDQAKDIASNDHISCSVPRQRQRILLRATILLFSASQRQRILLRMIISAVRSDFVMTLRATILLFRAISFAVGFNQRNKN